MCNMKHLMTGPENLNVSQGGSEENIVCIHILKIHMQILSTYSTSSENVLKDQINFP